MVNKDMLAFLKEFATRLVPAKATDYVYKDECMFSFDTPFSSQGIYTNLMTFQSFGEPFVLIDVHKSSRPPLYLHQKYTKVKKPDSEITEIKDKPSKLAIGIEGGFSTNPEEEKYDTMKEYHLVWFPSPGRPKESINISSNDIPSEIQEVVQSVLHHAGNIVQEETMTWEQETKESKYAANLVQVDSPPKISANPQNWKCQAPSCDKTTNLWLNLSDGYIGCGRKNWDGTGGCGAALDHYTDTGSKYPLAVKLGTITAEGGDVYSYASDEDDMVLNPHLKQHLQHFGINIANLKKTDKSMNELQVGLNLTYEFESVIEGGKKLKPLTGAGFIGFRNLGNSCYMNSVLQILLAIPEIQERYFTPSSEIFQSFPSQTSSPAQDFPCQLAKLANGVLTNRYSRTLDEASTESRIHDIELRPSTFRTLVGKGHPEFSTGQQQDAVEYFQYLLDYITRSERTTMSRLGPLEQGHGRQDDIPTANLFKFTFEDRVQCSVSNKVKYISRDEFIFSLSIPIESAINLDEVKQSRQNESDNKCKEGVDSPKRRKVSTAEPVVPIVPFDACLTSTLSLELLEDFLSSATQTKGKATKLVRFKSFPKYLVIQMRKFYIDEDWTPKKLEVNVNVPEFIDFSSYLSKGRVDGEELLPEDDQPNVTGHTGVSTAVTPDEALVAQLVSMGFSENGCKRAAIATGNASADVAMEWIFSHMEDPDFNEPPANDSSQMDFTSSTTHNPETISMLMGMGFQESHVLCALNETSGEPDRAADWLFSHMDNLDAAVRSANNKQTVFPSESNENVGRLDIINPESGKYQLMGFVSHLGKNTNSGHYICHIKKDDRWVLYNDDKVAESEDTPFNSGYLYFFRRLD